MYMFRILGWKKKKVKSYLVKNDLNFEKKGIIWMEVKTDVK